MPKDPVQGFDREGAVSRLAEAQASFERACLEVYQELAEALQDGRVAHSDGSNLLSALVNAIDDEEGSVTDEAYQAVASVLDAQHIELNDAHFATSEECVAAGGCYHSICDCGWET